MGSSVVELIDGHLHLQDPRLREDLDSIVAVLRRIGVSWWGVNGTGPQDWEEVARLARDYQEVFPFFGIHPWKVGTVDSEWESRLEEKLDEFPGAGIGEIGIDKWVRDPPLSAQREIFARQLSMAQRWKRPVAIHCLRAWGHLEEILEESTFDGPFLLHSFGGPREVLPSLCDRGAFFSISGYFFREDKKEKLDVFRLIPRDRILLETDAPDMIPPEEIRGYLLSRSSASTPLNHPANIGMIYDAYARFSHRTREEVAAEMRSNLDRWLDESFKRRREEPDRP